MTSFKWDFRDLRAKAALLARFRERADGLILEGLNNVANFSAKLSATEFMESKSREYGLFVSDEGVVVEVGDPPNPPPGPIGIRSAKLRQGLKVIAAIKRGKNFVVGLANDVVYAPIHEFGGTIPAQHIEGNPFLAFGLPSGEAVITPFVDIPARTIPARPFLRPALEKGTEERFDIEVTRALLNGIREIFGGGAIGDIGGSALLSFLGTR